MLFFGGSFFTSFEAESRGPVSLELRHVTALLTGRCDGLVSCQLPSSHAEFLMGRDDVSFVSVFLE